VVARALSREPIPVTDAKVDPAPVDMEALVREAWAGVDGASTVELSLGRLPAARGDRAMLSRAWSILLANAVRFCAGRDRPRIEVTGAEGADYAVYGVRDNGLGFDPGFMGKLIYFFERIQEEYPGTGVGLATVHRIVTNHGGSAWIEARRNRGALFKFSLPLLEIEPPKP
jgi:light-regulated signal transduction histidine kinase (bacteriophytochrome)